MASLRQLLVGHIFPRRLCMRAAFFQTVVRRSTLLAGTALLAGLAGGCDDTSPVGSEGNDRTRGSNNAESRDAEGCDRTEDVARVLSSTEYWAYQASFPLSTPAILALPSSSGADAAVIAPQVNGSPAEFTATNRQFRLHHTDNAGRDTTLSGCVTQRDNAVPVLSATIQRCLDGRCDNGTAEMRPLTSLPASSSAERASAYTLQAEYVGSDWDTGRTADVAVSDGVAWVARTEDGLRVVDIQDAANGVLTEISHVPANPGEIWNDVLRVNNWTLLGSSVRGLRVLDATDPAFPVTVVDEFPVGGANVHNIFLAGDTAYLARVGRDGGLSIVDLTNPVSPVLLGEYRSDRCPEVHDLYVQDNRAYLNCPSYGVVILDVSNPAAITELAASPSAGSHSTWVLGRTLLHSAERFGAGLELVQTEDLSPLSALATGHAASMHNLHCLESRCWIAAYQEGLIEINVGSGAALTDSAALTDGAAPTDDSEMQVVARFPTWNGPGYEFFEGASGVFAAPPLVFIADSERGLMVLKGPR